MSMVLAALPMPVNLIGKVRRDLTGQVFGRLTVKARDCTRTQGKMRWLCACLCGSEKAVPGDNLIAGTTVSCGCYRKEYLLSLSESFTGSIPHNKLDDAIRAVNRGNSLEAFRVSSVEELSDSYVMSLMTRWTGLSPEDIPQSLVGAKRIHLQTKREINEKRQ